MLESTQENISALIMGLGYLINICYVDDTEVFKVKLFSFSCSPSFFLLYVWVHMCTSAVVCISIYVNYYVIPSPII